jgi:hypothetical protein
LRKAFVIELFGHEMCLLSVVQVLNDCEGLEVNVISSDSVKANVMKSSFYSEDVEWHDVRTEEPISNRPLKNASNFKRVLTDVLKTVSSLSERNDLVLINTVECDLCHLLLRNLVEPLNVKGLKVFIGIHNSFLFMSGFAAELEKDLRRYYRLPLENRFRKKHLPLFLSTLMAEIVLRYRRTGLSPPAESTVCYDIMFAEAHKLHISVTTRACVPVNYCETSISEAILGPLRIITKNIKDWFYNRILNSMNCSKIVLITTYATEQSQIAASKKVSSPKVHAYGFYFSDFVG